MHEFELAWRRAIILSCLKIYNWNQCKAAVHLQLHRNTLLRAIHECRLEEVVAQQRASRK